MYIIFSLFAALFSSCTTLFAKNSLDNIDSTLICLLRTFVILILTFILYLLFGYSTKLDLKTIIFLILSGLSTTFLWLSYFKALSLADISLVTPVDKTGIVFTLILSFIFFKEDITITKILSLSCILLGTYIMINKKEKSKNNWFIYALLSALFTSLITIFGKASLKSVNPFYASLIRTIIVFVSILIIVLIKNKYKDIKKIDKITYKNLILSGLSTTLSWIFYFIALSLGDASVVYSLEKMSVIVVVFSKEKLNIKQIIGLVILLIGELLLIFK